MWLWQSVFSSEPFHEPVPADTAAIGAVMIPAMVRHGYNKGFAAALVASAATTDLLIPPSVAFVV